MVSQPINSVRIITKISYKRPLFVTRGSLNLDIAISPYTITPFFFYFSLFDTTGYLWDRDWWEVEHFHKYPSFRGVLNQDTKWG